MMLFCNLAGSLHGMVYLISLSKNSIAATKGVQGFPARPYAIPAGRMPLSFADAHRVLLPMRALTGSVQKSVDLTHIFYDTESEMVTITHP